MRYSRSTYNDVRRSVVILYSKIKKLDKLKKKARDKSVMEGCALDDIHTTTLQYTSLVFSLKNAVVGHAQRFVRGVENFPRTLKYLAEKFHLEE